MDRKKPKLLIIGHGRHGKDTVAALCQEIMGLAFTSSSEFVAREIIWDTWGKERYETYEEFFADRVNFRTTWRDLILAYNTPDRTRTATTMLNRGFDLYVGMRSYEEFKACKKAEIFNHVIWVDASKRIPTKDESLDIPSQVADLLIDNNGDIGNIRIGILNLQKLLHDEGYNVNYVEPDVEEVVEKGDRLEWTDKPNGAIQVLDHGFFMVKEVMCSDKEIAESARMSYGRGTKKINNDEGLINYLVKNHHTSPLEMGEIRFHMRLPIFVMRQLVRHRTANLNEYSGRYSEMVRLFYVPDIQHICNQDTVNKQGSAEPLDEDTAVDVQNSMFLISNAAFDTYEKLLSQKVSRETARIVLPLNTYTECVWKLDVSNLIKFLYLRDDDHAQYEIRVYAALIAEAVEHFFPLVYAAYKRSRESVSLTQEQVTALITGDLNGLAKGEAKVVRDLRFLREEACFEAE